MARQTLLAAPAACLLLLAALVGGAAPVRADEGAAPDVVFTLERAVVGAGGPHATGAGYALDATGGQPAAGLVTGTNLTLQAGFWSACVAAPAVMPVVTASRRGSDIVLTWPADPNSASYQVWVSTDPYFNPNAVAPTVVSPTTTFTDTGAAASLVNHYYIVRGLNACGAASANSARVGEFTFGLAPGM